MPDIDERVSDPLVAINKLIRNAQVGQWTAMPGLIQSYDPARNTASVQIAIMSVSSDKDGKSSSEPVSILSDVPVIFPRGGGYTLTFPLVNGDECLVVFASRNIDSWWQSGGVQPPVTNRIHDISDGFALVGPSSQARKIGGISTGTVQLRNDAGDTYVEVAGGGIVHIKAPTKIILDSPLVDIPAGDITVHTVDGTVGLAKHHHLYSGNPTTVSKPDP